MWESYRGSHSASWKGYRAIEVEETGIFSLIVKIVLLKKVIKLLQVIGTESLITL